MRDPRNERKNTVSVTSEEQYLKIQYLPFFHQIQVTKTHNKLKYNNLSIDRDALTLR